MTKSENNSSDYAAEFFVLRTPLLPFGELVDWRDGVRSTDNSVDPKQAPDERASLRKRLHHVCARPEVREALHVASPQLVSHYEQRMAEGTAGDGRKIENSLLKYFARMAGRATPFGLFAGYSTGAIGDQTRLHVPPISCCRRRVRPDMGVLFAVADAATHDPQARLVGMYRPNSSLRAIADQLRYSELREGSTGRSYRSVSVSASAPLQVVLKRAHAGASFDELSAALIDYDSEATRDEADDFIRELIDSHVLISDLTPAMTGEPPLSVMLDQLSDTQHRTPLVRQLESVQGEIDTLETDELGVHIGRYSNLTSRLRDLADQDPQKWLQVDMVKSGPAGQLGTDVVEELLRGVTLLQRVAPPGTLDELSAFRDAFVDRYQQNGAPRWVSLLEALDDELGVGFGADKSEPDTSLLECLNFPENPAWTMPWGHRETCLLKKLTHAIEHGDRKVELASADVDELSSPHAAALPDAFAVLASLALDPEPSAGEQAIRIVLDSAAGPSGARLLGRFCFSDPELSDHVKRHLAAEEALHPEAVFAEIVHQPAETRLANVLLRPRLREYEIVHLGTSRAPAEKQIPLHDLDVAVVGDEVVLRSRRLGRRVIPRLSNAHNYRQPGDSAYRFLCMLQDQGTASCSWTWGPLHSAPFLPRVVSGRTVLCRARWLFAASELAALVGCSQDDRHMLIQQWRNQRHMPRWVMLAEDDNELPIDLDNPLSVDSLADAIKGRDTAILVEMLPAPDQLGAAGPEGRYVHELIVPFVRQTAVSQDRSSSRYSSRDCIATATRWSAPQSDVKRRFPPGSEWLYVKLYTGHGLADQVLIDVARPVAEHAVNCGAADSWHFVRYGDPDWHLRLRFRGDANRLHANLLPFLYHEAAPLLADGRIRRVQFDTYEREVERYGGAEGIAIAEQVFHADSQAAAALCELLRADAAGELRWRLAFLGIDRLLDDLGYDPNGKLGLLRRLDAVYASEFNVDGRLRRDMGIRYRALRPALETMLFGDSTGDPQVEAGRTILQSRSIQLRPLCSELWAKSERLCLPMDELAGSFLHMHANRVLLSSQRRQELVLYNFLRRIYQSRAARNEQRLGTNRPATPGGTARRPSRQNQAGSIVAARSG